VTIADPPKTDMMESFWMGASLKYFYLLFCEPGVLNLDQWVFSEGGHPFRWAEGKGGG